MFKRKTHKKIFSLMMVFAMVFSCFSNGMVKATANNTSPKASEVQIVEQGGENPSDDKRVKVSKTIEGTDTENVFDITLKVQTQENLEEIQSSPDAATVLVLDKSASMNETLENGKTRFKVMKEAAVDFVDSYAEVVSGVSNEKAKRWIAIMTFGAGATSEMKWIDVAASDSNKNEVINYINSMKKPTPGQGTNIQGGLQLAYNYLDKFNNDEAFVKGQFLGTELPKNSNVILLSDGCPTWHISSYADKDSLDYISGVRGGGTEAYTTDWMPVGGSVKNGNSTVNSTTDNPISKQIKDKGVNLFSIAFSTGKSYFFTRNTNKGKVEIDTFEWMKSFSDNAFKSNNREDLIEHFANINEIIRLSAQAWIVTDEMGTHIDFAGVDEEFDKSRNSKEFNSNSNTLVWNVRASQYASSESNGKVTTYTYELKYRVVLDTTTENVDYGKEPTNGDTILKYFLSEQIGTADPSTLIKTVDFKVPAVTGMFGEFGFTKLDEKNNPIKGVEFTLKGKSTGSEKDVTRVVQSDKNGLVSFTGIPAGVYELTEKAPTGYKQAGPWEIVVSYGETTVTGDGLGSTVINYPINRPLTVSKVWAGLTDEQKKDIPNEVTVKILRNNNEYETIKLNKNNNWTQTINVPWGDDNNNPYAYSVEEVGVNGYTTAIDGTMDTGFVITNTYSPELSKLSGTKTWDLPEGTTTVTFPDITVTLQRSLDGTNWENVSSQTLKHPDVEYTFSNVAKTAPNGKDYQFKVEEAPVNGYTPTYNDELDITNTYTPGNTSVEVEKVWRGINTKDPLPVITVQLMQNKDTVKGSITLNAETGWKHTFENLPVYAPNGTKYTYEVKEVMPEGATGYTSATTGNATDGFVITNTLKTDKTSIDVEKIWQGVPDGTVKPTITLHLLQNDEEFRVAKLENGTTSHTFDNLPKYSSLGTEYVYTVTEDKVEGFTTEKVVGNNKVTFTNTYTGELKDKIGSKTWSNVPDGAKVPDVTIILQQKIAGQPDSAYIDFKDVTLENGKTEIKFEDIPTIAPTGEKYEYQLKELEVNGYTSSIAGMNVTNTYTPGETSLSVEKKWVGVTPNDDGSNVPTVEVQLYQNGIKVEGKVATLTKADSYKHTFTGLAKYATDGTEYKYTAKEIFTGGAGYTSNANDNGSIITNTFDNTKISVDVTKVWKDVPTGTVVPNITVQLLRDGEKFNSVELTNTKRTHTFTGLDKYNSQTGNAYVYTVEEVKINGYDAKVTGNATNGFTITNTYDGGKTTSINGKKVWVGPDGTQFPTTTINLQRKTESTTWVDVEGKVVTIESSTNKEKGFGFENLPTIAPDGSTYEYRFIEKEAPNGYVMTQNGNTITNTYNSEETSLIVNKQWVNTENGDGYPTIKVQLLQNGVDYRKPLEITQTDNWTRTFGNLPIYAPNGERYVYTVREILPDGTVGYEKPIYEAITSGNGYTIINTFITTKIDVTVNKVWSNETADHPTITLKLLRDGIDTDRTATLENGKIKHTFNNLPKYSTKGTEYVYTVEELPVVGYETTYSKDTLTITNTFTNEMIDVAGTKTWDVPANTTEYPTITIILERTIDNENWEEVKDITLENGETSYDFGEMNKYATTSEEYTYRVRELDVNGYEVRVEGYNITNTYTGGKAITISGTKTWDTPTNEHPTITINLLQNGKEIREEVLANGVTTYSFVNLPTYAPDGTEYKYTVTEDVLNGYETTVEGYNVTNKYTGGDKIKVEGTKTWSNPTETHPTITVNLLQNGEKIREEVLANGVTTYSFNDLPTYAPDGTEYKYTVTEDAVNGYETQVEGYNITNTYTGGEKTKVEGTKTWSNPDETHPTITVNLIRNGVRVDTTVLENGVTEYLFDNLPTYAPDGTEYKYTVTEDAVNGYETTIDVNNITNTYAPGETSLIVHKQWVNTEDGDGYPTIKVQVLQNGKAFGKAVEMTEENDWTLAFAELPVYAPNGEKYDYSVAEILPDGTVGYSVEISGGITTDGTGEFQYTIVNTFDITAKTEVTVNKVWSNETADHPAITLKLLRDGIDTGKTVTLENGETSYTFEGLQKYSTKGTAYVYTVEELEVVGYETGYSEDTLTITNTFTNEMIDVAGTKTWEVPADTTEYPTITIILERTIDNENWEEVKDITLENGETSYDFGEVNKYATTSEEYKYRVRELDVNGYDAQVNGYNLTNTYNPDQIELTVQKRWNNVDVETDVLPTIVVELLRNNEVVDSIEMTQETGYSYTFEGLDKQAVDGSDYEYTVREVLPDGTVGYETEYGYDGDAFIFNTFDNESTVDVPVTKVWANVPEGEEVPSITLHLYQDGEELTDRQVTLEAGVKVDNIDNYVFEGLPKYSTEGREYVYTVEEATVAGYEATVETTEDGIVITNTYTGGEATTISGTKTWENIEEDEIVPDITLRLIRDGEEIDEVVLTNGTLSYEFTDLPTVAYDGHVYEYDVTEDAVDGFESVKNGFDFTNVKEDEVLGDKEEPVLPVLPPIDEDEVLGDVEEPINTGDHTGMELYGFLGFVAVAGMALLRRKKES